MTRIIQDPLNEGNLPAVNMNSLWSYITVESGTAHNWYILELDMSTEKMHLIKDVYSHAYCFKVKGVNVITYEWKTANTHTLNLLATLIMNTSTIP